MKPFFTIFISVFLAEIGDKTQLATMLYATDQAVSKKGVFVAAAGALVLSTLLAVTAGEWISRTISPHTLKLLAGGGFIAIGIWMLYTEL